MQHYVMMKKNAEIAATPADVLDARQAVESLIASAALPILPNERTGRLTVGDIEETIEGDFWSGCAEALSFHAAYKKELPMRPMPWGDLEAMIEEDSDRDMILSRMAEAWAGERKSFPLAHMITPPPAFRLVDDADRLPDRKGKKGKRAGWTEERRAKRAATIDKKRIAAGHSPEAVAYARETGKRLTTDPRYTSRYDERIAQHLVEFITHCMEEMPHCLDALEELEDFARNSWNITNDPMKVARAALKNQRDILSRVSLIEQQMGLPSTAFEEAVEEAVKAEEEPSTYRYLKYRQGNFAIMAADTDWGEQSDIEYYPVTFWMVEEEEEDDRFDYEVCALADLPRRLRDHFARLTQV